MQLPRKVRLTQSGLRHAADTPHAAQRRPSALNLASASHFVAANYNLTNDIATLCLTCCCLYPPCTAQRAARGNQVPR
jgi:hypothetical protein